MNNFESIKNEFESTIDNRTYAHCIRTIDVAVKLAELYNINIEQAKIAALLHDCGKLYKVENNNLNHARLGMDIAINKYNVEDIDILNAIRYHTTGRESMTMLEKIIYISDKIEESRNYKGVEEIRNLAYNDIDSAIIKSLYSTIEYVKNKNLEFDEQSLKTLNYLIKEKEFEYRP